MNRFEEPESCYVQERKKKSVTILADDHDLIMVSSVRNNPNKNTKNTLPKTNRKRFA